MTPAELRSLAHECRLRAKLDPGARCGDLLLPAARELVRAAAAKERKGRK